MQDKPKVAFYWCASCGGCEETVVDLEEKILDVVSKIDIIFWPCAMDFKYSDVEELKPGDIDISFINGAIRTSEQEHIAKMLREKSKLVIAFGSCSCLGGIPALANLKNKNAILERAYIDSPTVKSPPSSVPMPENNQNKDSLPDFYETVLTLQQVIEVDYFLPGCPPTSEVLLQAVSTILSGKLPGKGSVLLPDVSLCHSCNRNDTKPDQLLINEIRRVHEVIADPEKCFLAQGIVCMGPATRDGCGFPCVKGNMPCTGCFGPLEKADQGARMTAALGGILRAENEEEMEAFLKALPDPAGTFYRYSLSASLIGSKRQGGSS